MTLFILRRLGQAVLTVLGVMIITFVLFRVIAGDIAGANLGEKATARAKAAWRHNFGYDLPTFLNVDNQLLLTDMTVPDSKNAAPLRAKDAAGSQAIDVLELIPGDISEEAAQCGLTRQKTVVGKYVSAGYWVANWGFDRQTPITVLTGGKPLVEVKRPPAAAATLPPASQPATSQAASEPATSEPTTVATSVPSIAPTSVPATQPATAPTTQPTTASQPAAAPQQADEAMPDKPSMIFMLGDDSKIVVDIAGIETAGDFIDRVNNAPGNNGKLVAGITKWTPSQLLKSQFVNHLRKSATFSSVSLKDDNPTLTDIIRKRAPYSLAITVPSMALEWMLGLIVACFVAYYRSTWIDKVGVFVTVLGMCIPFLAFMILGQWLAFKLWPEYAFGVENRTNLYIPIAIVVIAGLGGMVRFYRTVILDETNRDYVRTARAKGVPLPSILFKHILRNCMLPILTSLVMAIPFLIMGNMLVENYFGIPGLGDLMLTSIQDRNEPIMNGLVFMTTVIYIVGILLTDISYAIFDPRIRLK
ncbi:MAG: ABC transporter permease subunit [Planctomycetaceae bacterium]|nr:MAG: ABC transporter permease subunit [Planctomycetaceae bacterium]